MGIFGRTAPHPDDICAQLDEGAEIRPDDDPTRLSCNVRLAGGRRLPFSDIGDAAESCAGLSNVDKAPAAAGLQTSEFEALSPSGAIDPAAPPAFTLGFFGAAFFGGMST